MNDDGDAGLLDQSIYLNTYLYTHAQAIGLRNLVESEIENRHQLKRALQAQINEKMAELER